MQSCLVIVCCGFYLGFVCLLPVQGRVIYQCDFDNATLKEHCFTTDVLVFSGFAFLSERPPDSPTSDVTSSLKPTKNGEVCKLPYRISNYTWDMYFCYNNVCPTNTSANSTCTPGQFAAVELFGSETRSLQLKTESGGMDGIDEQHLTYYYHMSNLAGKRIQVRKEESDGASEIVDTVTNSPYNGWIKREVRFIAVNRGYQLYFDVQRTSSETSPIEVGLDEISIWQEEETTTEDPTTTAMVSTQLETTASDSTLQEMTTEQSTVAASAIHTSTMMFTSTATLNPTTANATLTSYLTSALLSSDPATSESIRPTTSHIASTYSETTYEPPAQSSPTTTTTTTSIEPSSTTTTTSTGPSSTTTTTSTEPFSTITTTSTRPLSTTTTNSRNVTTSDDTGTDEPFPTAYAIIIIVSAAVSLTLLIFTAVFIKIKWLSARPASTKTRVHPSTENTSDLQMILMESF